MPRHGSRACGRPGRTGRGRRAGVPTRRASTHVRRRRAPRRSSAARPPRTARAPRGPRRARARSRAGRSAAAARRRRRAGTRPAGTAARRPTGRARAPPVWRSSTDVSAGTGTPGRRRRSTRRSPRAAARRAADAWSGRAAGPPGSMCIRASPAGAIPANVSISGPSARSGARRSAACASVPSSATSIVANDRPRSAAGRTSSGGSEIRRPTDVACLGGVTPSSRARRAGPPPRAPTGRTACPHAARARARGRTRSR